MAARTPFQTTCMLFNSIEFLIFFPIVCVIYWVLPSNRWRNIFLLIASYYFYMNWEPIYAFLIMFSTVSTWYAAKRIAAADENKKRKMWLTVCLVANFGILFVFKYFNFITDSVFSLLNMAGLRMQVPSFPLLLPVGISFYTFQAVGYILDVKRGKFPPTKSLWKYALFVSFFPQLVAGPIERPSNLLPQFDVRHRFNGVMFVEGIKMMLFGYFMKLCIADNVSGYVDAVFNNLDFHNGTSVLLASFFFTFQILCDFGGYSLIAIGAALCMGFTLMQNFRQPYLTVSPRDFWRRWHISLSSWFTEYVYIPLGGNRCSKARHAFNNMATMLISGLWHGANWTYILWGGYHGVLVTADGLLSKNKKTGSAVKGNKVVRALSKCISILVMFVLIMGGWIFFRANNVGDAFKAFRKIATEPGMLFKGEGVPSLLMALMLIGILMIVEIYREWRGPRELPQHLSKLRLTRDIAYSALLVVMILLCGSFSGGQFIYFQF